MATSLSLLLLLSLAAGDLLLRSDAAAVNDVCSKTKDPRRCLSLLTSSDTRADAAALPVLGEIAITAATDVAGDVKAGVQGLLVSARDPKLKDLYRECEDRYRSSLDELLIAPEYLQKRNYGKLAAAAGVVRDGAGRCAAAVAKEAGLKRKNEDTGVLGEAIAVIAKTLA